MRMEPMPLNQVTRDAIHAYLLGELSRYLHENAEATAEVDTKPFHTRLLPALFAVELSERSFSTRSGNWFQEIARLVASQFHPVVRREHSITGPLSAAASAHIEEILREMDKGQPKRIPVRAADLHGVLAVQGAAGTPITITADLFIQTVAGEELYFEMKTPSPNRKQSLEMKRFILQVMAVRRGNNAQAYASTAYNPYGDGQPYIWKYSLQFHEIGQDLLIGRTFWERIGDPSTYDEILEIAEQVGKDALPLLADIAEDQDQS